jgi:archaellum component FlaF (FlaF/FlaG flagellin family)
MKFVRHRRGLSNVVTAAIMLTAVAAMGSGLVAWSHGNLKVFEISLASITSTTTNKINENLAIENVYFCANPCIAPNPAHGVNVTLTNIGTLSVNVTQIQINSTNYIKTNCCKSVIILPKQSYTMTVWAVAWVSKDIDTITVTTQRGSIFTTQAAPP